MLKAVFTALTQVKQSTYPTGENDKGSKGTNPSFFRSQDLFIRQIHSLMDLAEDVSSEKDVKHELVQRLTKRHFHRSYFNSFMSRKNYSCSTSLLNKVKIQRSSKKSFPEGKDDTMTTIHRSNEQAISEIPSPDQGAKTIKAVAYAWGKFLYAVPHSSYTYVTETAQSIAKEAGRQTGLTIKAFGNGFWEGLRSTNRGGIEDSPQLAKVADVSTSPPSAAYKCGAAVRQTFIQFSDGALGKEHGTSLQKTVRKKQFLDRRAQIPLSDIVDAMSSDQTISTEHFLLPEERLEDESENSDQAPATSGGLSLQTDIYDLEEVTSEESEVTYSETLSSMLTSMSQWIKSGVKVKATSLMLDALGYTLKQAYSNSQDRAVKDQISDMIDEVEKVKSGRANFDRLRSTLTRIINGQNASGTQVRNMLQLHLQGIFEIPIRENHAEDNTYRQILMQHIEGIPDTQNTISINYKKEIPKVQDRLVKNITALSSLQAANHLILNNALSDEMISEILQGCDRQNSNYLENIKKRFYREVDRLDIATFQKITSKLLYAAVDFFTSFSLQRFISSLIKKIEVLATSSSLQRTEEQHNKIFKNINDFLCVLKGTLKRVRSNTEPTANVQRVTEMELSKPKFNHGFTKERLYSEVCFKAVEDIFPPLGWTEDFMKGESKQNMAIKTVKLILVPIVWICECVCNRIIKTILHIVLSKSNIVEMIIDKSLNQVSRNGHTHSINKIFYEQLRLMWIEMHSEDQKTEAIDPSIANREELRDFIINLYDVLELNRQSRHSLGESTILEKAKESLYKMSTDYSAEAIALLINKAKNTFLTPELLPMREYTMMEALNASIESRSTDTEEEMLQLEQDIVQLRDAILSKAIRTVVHKSFDSRPTLTERAFEKISIKLSNILTRNIEVFKKNLNQDNKIELIAAIRDCSKAILDLQRLVEDDPALRSESRLFYKFYTTPIATMLAQLRTSAMSNEQKDKKKGIISSMQVWLEEMPKVKHINSTSLPSVSSTVEGAANWIALKAGKEFFDEAWSLMRKPYIWRYGVVHRTLISFIEGQ